MKEYLLIAYVRPMSYQDEQIGNVLRGLEISPILGFNMPLCMCYRFQTEKSINDISFELRSLETSYFIIDITKGVETLGFKLPDIAYAAMTTDFKDLAEQTKEPIEVEEDIQTMDVDQLLDLMNKCGGLDRMPEEAQTRLKELSK